MSKTVLALLACLTATSCIPARSDVATPAPPIPLSPLHASASVRPNLRDLVAQAFKATVTVVVPVRMPDGRQLASEGAGVAVAKDKVLTCRHIWEHLPPGAVVGAAVVLLDSAWGDDAGGTRSAHTALPNVQFSSQFDLALMVVPGLDAAPVALGSDGETATGDDVFFIGHPFFDTNKQATVSTAIISAKVVENGSHFFILDGPANHGNSGGALLSRDTGKLLGIVVEKRGEFDENLQRLADPSLTGGAGIIAGRFDIVKVLQEAVVEMGKNVQLGVSKAVRIQDIEAFLKSADPQDFGQK